MQRLVSLTRHDLGLLLAWPLINTLVAYSLIQYIDAMIPDTKLTLLMSRITLFWFTMSAIFWGLSRFFRTIILKKRKKSIVRDIFINLALVVVAIEVGLMLIAPMPVEDPMPRIQLISYANILLQVAIYTVIVHNWRLEKQAIELEVLLKRSELSLLRMQTNPHFLFNTLNLISNEIPQRPDLAQELIFDLSDLLRGTISLSNQKRIKIQEEIDLVNHYLTLQKARFGDRLVTELQLDTATPELCIPPMLILPLVENVIKHAVSKTHRTVTLTISTWHSENGLAIKVSNTWPENSRPVFAPGSGLQNIIDTLKLEYPDASLVTDHHDGESTATITIRHDLSGELACIA